MSIVWTILIGFIAGLVARAIKPGDDSAGFIMTTLIGIAGSYVGAGLAELMNFGLRNSLDHFLAALVGSIIVLWVWRALHVGSDILPARRVVSLQTGVRCVVE